MARFKSKRRSQCLAASKSRWNKPLDKTTGNIASYVHTNSKIMSLNKANPSIYIQYLDRYLLEVMVTI